MGCQQVHVDTDILARENRANGVGPCGPEVGLGWSEIICNHIEPGCQLAGQGRGGAQKSLRCSTEPNASSFLAFTIFPTKELLLVMFNSLQQFMILRVCYIFCDFLDSF